MWWLAMLLLRPVMGRRRRRRWHRATGAELPRRRQRRCARRAIQADGVRKS